MSIIAGRTRLNIVFRNELLKSLKHFSTSSCCLIADGQSMRAVIDKNASDIFISRHVQKLLRKLTGLDLDVVFRKRALGQELTAPGYRFMTTEQLQNAEKSALKKAYKLLQMPPVVPIQNQQIEVLEEVPQMIGFDLSKYIFTDISFGVSDRKRFIVVREPSGMLRHAIGDERDRMNQIYFPRPGKMLRVPKMFDKENLERLWKDGEFVFILDRTCCQFEPDNPKFHEVALETYRRIYDQAAFHKLKSTRHYGPMVFYYALNKNIDALLLDYIERENINDAVSLVKLYHAVNRDCNSINFELTDSNQVDFVQAFIEMDSKNSQELISALKSYVDVTKIKELEQNAAEA